MLWCTISNNCSSIHIETNHSACELVVTQIANALLVHMHPHRVRQLSMHHMVGNIFCFQITIICQGVKWSLICNINFVLITWYLHLYDLLLVVRVTHLHSWVSMHVHIFVSLITFPMWSIHTHQKPRFAHNCQEIVITAPAKLIDEDAC